MDRNSAIGLGLIACALLIYFQFFAPKPMPEPSSAQVVPNEIIPATSAAASIVAQPDDSLSVKEKFITLENADLKLSISSFGSIKEVQLKNYKKYGGKPLFLASSGNNLFSLQASIGGVVRDLYREPYQYSVTKQGDTTVVTLKTSLNNGVIRHIYRILPTGFRVEYQLQTTGIAASDKFTYEWIDLIPLQEKDMKDFQQKTTVNYYTATQSFEDLSATSDESEMLPGPVNWVSIKQKFFISAVLSNNAFLGGEVSIANPTSQQDTIAKIAHLKLNLPAKSQISFDYFFGPNSYDALSDMPDGFSRNLYLGWPPVIWVNKFVIMPIFNFLKAHVSNFGIVILLLVVIVKAALTPLSYKSYLGMAKMRLLKPEIDAIKEKNQDNLAQTQQDQMKLYRQAGVNPLSGCIPIFLQMPILFAMFYFIPVAIDLRQQPFLWAEDLSTYDSILNLPFTIPFYGSHVSLFVLLMTISSLIYTWQNNQISSVQGPMKSVSYAMPVVFLFILNNFSAGLSFYYFISNLITFAQQAIIKRFVDEDKVLAIMEENKRKSANGTGKKSKFMTKLEEAMKAGEEARRNNKKK